MYISDFLFLKIHHTLFFNDRRSIFQIFKMCEILKKSEISQTVLQKCITFKIDSQILGRVKMFVGSSPSFSTPNFLSGPSKKGSTFMIAFGHNLILRNFQIFAKTKNSPFSMPIYHQTGYNTEKKSYSMTTGTEKRKKCTSQIFDF